MEVNAQPHRAPVNNLSIIGGRDFIINYGLKDEKTSEWKKKEWTTIRYQRRDLWAWASQRKWELRIEKRS